MGRDYPGNPADAALALFLDWFGGHYARSTKVVEREEREATLAATVRVGRGWSLRAGVVDTLSPATTPGFEAERAVVERRLDDAGQHVALWVPRGAPLPTEEPRLSELAAAVEEATELEDGRLEVRRPVTLYLRRTSTDGSVVTALGGLSPQWARFTGKVAGSFQLNSNELYRLPHSEDERTALAERIVAEAGQPTIDEGTTIRAEDVWTANRLREDRAYVLGAPGHEDDRTGPALRRAVRKQLAGLRDLATAEADARALVVIGEATYADEEKLSWLIRGADPSLYAGFEIIAVIADGVVKALLQPERGRLPWDAPLG